MLAHTLIHAFITAADKDDALVRHYLLRHGLGEQLPLRRQKYDRFARSRALWRDLQRLKALEDRLRLEHHAFAASEWPVVDGAMTVVREGAKIVNSDFYEPGITRAANDAIIQRPAKKVRKNRQDFELHFRMPRVLPPLSGLPQVSLAIVPRASAPA